MPIQQSVQQTRPRAGHRWRWMAVTAVSLVTGLLALQTHAAVVPASSPALWPLNPTSVSLVINEVDYDQPGTDFDEFVEIKNVSGAPIGLDGYYVVLINGANNPGTEYDRVDLPAVTLPVGGRYVVCGGATATPGTPRVPNCDLAWPDTSNIIQNGAPDAVAIVSNPTLTFGTATPNGAQRATLAANDTIVDSVSYEGNTGGGVGAETWTEGTGVPGSGDPGDANRGLARIDATTAADGVDTDNNSVDVTVRCISPGQPNVLAITGCPDAVTNTPTPAATNAATATPSATSALATATPTAVPTDTPPGLTATSSPSGTIAAPTETAPPTDTPLPPTETAPPTGTSPPPSPTPLATETAPPPTSPSTATPADSPTLTPTAVPGVPLPVQLLDLGARRVGRVVFVRWETVSEIKHAGFRVWRDAGGGELMAVGRPLIPGRGGEIGGARYSVPDVAAPYGVTSYWLDDVSTTGAVRRHGPVMAPAYGGRPIGVPRPPSESLGRQHAMAEEAPALLGWEVTR